MARSVLKASKYHNITDHHGFETRGILFEVYIEATLFNTGGERLLLPTNVAFVYL
jgi:hypothetical protein